MVVKPWVVQKFGGTSVGKFPRQIADDIVKQYSGEYKVVVVCSARSTDTKEEGTTTRLLKAASECLEKNDYKEAVEAVRRDHVSEAEAQIGDEAIREQLVKDIHGECDTVERFLEAAQVIDEVSPRTMDSIMSAGERLSCLFMAALMNDRGLRAQCVDLSRVIPMGHDVGRGGLDQDFYTFLTERITDAVCAAGDCIPVVTGFFGTVPGGLLGGVGRGYTDLCAALCAVGVGADELQIWKEVDGIFTADPRKVPTARLIGQITPEEAAELTYYGSEVIHPFTMEQVIRARIPIRIKNVLTPGGAGTVIFPDDNSRPGEQTPLHPPERLPPASAAAPKLPTAVTIKKDVLVLNVHSNKKNHSHGFMARVFGTLDRWQLSVDLISTSEVHVSMALHSSLPESALRDALAELRQHGSVDVTRKMCIVSLVGKQMKHLVGIAGRMFTTLAEAQVNIEMISQGASEINISCVIEERDALKALNVLHQRLLCQVQQPPLMS
ncbi:hypothetical protein TRICI_003529 [Trichomonascus ciferrii]|uniref:Aspartokinase n=1 Tax=Trichomonascus ciferrii TaxID=44093 RepID=A0A642V2U2_9ASCO|nr:hypothetical protein TRICI_003529 [Trichomonascus ciferrii]